MQRTIDRYRVDEERSDDLVVKQFVSTLQSIDEGLLGSGALLQEVITTIRDAKIKNHVKSKEKITLHVHSSEPEIYSRISPILSKQLNAIIKLTDESVPKTISVVVKRDKFYIETETVIDTSAQKNELLKDLEYLEGFLLSVEKKLSNERFVQNARTEVIELERKKKSDAEIRLAAIKESLEAL